MSKLERMYLSMSGADTSRLTKKMKLTDARPSARGEAMGWCVRQLSPDPARIAIAAWSLCSFCQDNRFRYLFYADFLASAGALSDCLGRGLSTL